MARISCRPPTGATGAWCRRAGGLHAMVGRDAAEAGEPAWRDLAALVRRAAGAAPGGCGAAGAVGRDERAARCGGGYRSCGRDAACGGGLDCDCTAFSGLVPGEGSWPTAGAPARGLACGGSIGCARLRKPASLCPACRTPRERQSRLRLRLRLDQGLRPWNALLVDVRSPAAPSGGHSNDPGESSEPLATSAWRSGRSPPLLLPPNQSPQAPVSVVRLCVVPCLVPAASPAATA